MNIILRAARRLQRLAWHTQFHRFGMLEIARVPALPAPTGLDVQFHDAAHPADDDALETIKQRHMDWGERWRRGHLCFLIRCEGEPAAYLWIARDGWRWRDEDPPGPMPPLVDFHYDLLTVPRFRGLFGYVLSAWAERARADERLGGWQLVNDQNRPMQLAAARAGWSASPYGVRVSKSFGRVVARRSSQPPTGQFEVISDPAFAVAAIRARSASE